MTLPHPVASFVATGKMKCVTFSSAPPSAGLIGKRLVIHAGHSLCKIGDVAGNAVAQVMVEAEACVKPGEWRDGLDRLKATYAGRTVATAQLSAAFMLGETRELTGHEGRVRLSPYRFDSHGGWYMGDWKAYIGHLEVPIGDWRKTSARDQRRRWVWCFSSPHLIPAVERHALKGFGGLWHVENGVAYRRRETRKQEQADYQAAMRAERAEAS